MKVVDSIFALICGRVVGFLVSDFLRGFGVPPTAWEKIIIWLLFPFLALLGLWIGHQIGKKIPFIFQAAKFFLVGAFATVFDLKFFELLIWLFPIYFIAKAISFICSTSIKYWGNKYWAFQKHEKEEILREVIQFFFITLAGLVIDIASFYYLTQVLGAPEGFPYELWVKLSVVLAAIAAAVSNFLGYKFVVFKK